MAKTATSRKQKPAKPPADIVNGHNRHEEKAGVSNDHPTSIDEAAVDEGVDIEEQLADVGLRIVERVSRDRRRSASSGTIVWEESPSGFLVERDDFKGRFHGRGGGWRLMGMCVPFETREEAAQAARQLFKPAREPAAPVTSIKRFVCDVPIVTEGLHEHFPEHVKLTLTGEACLKLRGIALGCARLGMRLSNGQPVVTGDDAVRWLIERLHPETGA